MKIDDGERPARPARDWVKVLARYREPLLARSLLEVALTVVPFVVFWLAAVWALSVSYALAGVLVVPAAFFLVRIFLIQHDCGHGSFFASRRANDWLGRVFGVLTFTPYAVWRRSHAIHHASTGNLDKRGIGDINTLTVREYAALAWYRKLAYRLYRNPLVMFGIGPAYIFLIDNRIPPAGQRRSAGYWMSAVGTNLAIAAVVTGLFFTIGIKSMLLVHLPIILLASSLGVWLFYVQHQFEKTVWAHNSNWNLHEAALRGSSYYALPGWLSWLTGNIGIHHVHHLYSRIPFYRLSKVLRDFPELAETNKITLRQSLGTLKLRLWDESRGALVSFASAKRR